VIDRRELLIHESILPASVPASNATATGRNRVAALQHTARRLRTFELARGLGGLSGCLALGGLGLYSSAT